MYNSWLRLLTMLLPGPDLHCAGPLVLWDLRNIFLPNIGEDQKQILHERGAPGTVPYVKSVPGYCITFIKRLHEGMS